MAAWGDLKSAGGTGSMWTKFVSIFATAAVTAWVAFAAGSFAA
jgi:hypothetical protein